MENLQNNKELKQEIIEETEVIENITKETVQVSKKDKSLLGYCIITLIYVVSIFMITKTFTQQYTVMNQQCSENLNKITDAFIIYAKNNSGTIQVIPQTPIENQETSNQNTFDNSPFLGVAVYNTEESATPFGVQIAYVYENSPAFNIGMRENDIIMSIDGNEVKTFEDLGNIIKTYNYGDTVEIQYARGTETGIIYEIQTVALDAAGNYDLNNEIEE